MLLLDDNTPSIIAAAAGKTAEIPTDEFSEGVKTFDSTAQAISDSLKSLNVTDIKAVVTGENTILKDGLKALTEMTVGFIPKLLGAIVVLWIGIKLAKLLKNLIIKGLDRRGAEPSLKSFLSSLCDVLLKAMIIIMAMDIIGIKATSFIALLGAMGLAIGMALQGTLQNFAGGVIILLMKPFKVNDYIECGQYAGYVKEIRIFHTIMHPFNGRTFIIPNSELATKSITNHTKEPIIRLDILASVAYGTDLQKVKKVLWDVVRSEKEVVWEPKKPTICVVDLGANSVDFKLWMWVKVEDYWTLWEHIREDIYIAFNENDIKIPFSQMTVHQAGPDVKIHMEPREDGTFDQPHFKAPKEDMEEGA